MNNKTPTFFEINKIDGESHYVVKHPVHNVLCTNTYITQYICAACHRLRTKVEIVFGRFCIFFLPYLLGAYLYLHVRLTRVGHKCVYLHTYAFAKFETALLLLLLLL